MDGTVDAAVGRLLTPQEAAEWFRVDAKTVSRWADQGKLHCYRTPGRHRRYYENEVSALLRGESWEPPGGFQTRERRAG
jgi:excisionase family DNA binding protein